jgi:hypothetical protein
VRLRPRATEPEPSFDEPLAASVAGRMEEIVAAAEQTAAPGSPDARSSEITAMLSTSSTR